MYFFFVGEVNKTKTIKLCTWQGFAQVEGLDFFETYAPTCKPETFRILLGVAAQKDLHLSQMDVKSAYLHSTIEEEIYMEQPEGFVKRGEDEQTLYCIDIPLHCSHRERIPTKSQRLLCLCEKRSRWYTFVHTTMGRRHHSNEVIDAIKSMLKENFKMDDRGTLHWFLGVQILRSEDKITVDQEKYIESVLSQFKMCDEINEAGTG